MGSNSLKLYLVKPEDGAHFIETTKYPWSVAHEFFANGSLPEAAADEVVASLRQALKAARGAELAGMLAVATGVFREIRPLDDFVERIERETNVRVRVISGADEARLMARGFRDLPVKPPLLLCDLGGATTEWVWIRDGAEPECGSMQLGAIRNQYLADSGAHCDTELAALPVTGPTRVVATGGTAEALAAIVGADEVTAEQLRGVIDDVRRDGAPEFLKPSRQKVLLTGLEILAKVLERCETDRLNYGTAAVRHGMVRRLIKLLDRVAPGQLHATQLLRTMDGGDLLTQALTEGDELEAGARVGRYEVVEQLGAGGMGTVYRAKDPELGRDVALKIMHARGRTGDRLLREAQAMAKLSHPNVVAVHDVGKHGDDVFVAMELVEGKTLSAWRRERKRSTAEVLDVFAEAGAGLAAAHAAGLVHGDFKPDNVIVGNDGRVRIVDFGLARAGSAEDDTLHRRDSGSGVVGTPAYMAPEQFRREAIDESTDQFSFCVALWQALYDQLPFAGDTLEEVEAAVTEGRLREPPSGADVPARIRQILERGLAVDPKARHPAMAQLLPHLARRTSSTFRTAFATAALASALAVAFGIWYARADQAPDPCATAGDELQGVWDAEVKTAAKAAFVASGRPHANATYTRVETVLDGHAAAWAAMRVDACRETRVHRRQSQADLDLRDRCLDERLEQLRAFASALADEPSASLIDNAVYRAFDLGHIEDCADAKALAATGPGPSPRPPGDACGVSELGRYNPLEIGRIWLYDVVDPSTGLPRNKEPKVITVEALEPIGGCKGDIPAYRIRRASGPGYALRYIEVRTVDSPAGHPPGQVSIRHRDTWFTNDGVARKAEYFVPGRVRLDESCARTVGGAVYSDSYEEVEVAPGAYGCGKTTDRKAKTFDWQVLGTEVPIEVRLDYSHPACCPPDGAECGPPANNAAQRCVRVPDNPALWDCTFKTLQVNRSEVDGGKRATYWFAPGVGKVKEDSPGEELESLVCFRVP